MAVNSGWQPPTHAGKFFATLAALVIVSWGYMTIPSGCESTSPTRSRTALPGSPLEKKSDGSSVVAAGTAAVTADAAVLPATKPLAQAH